MQSTISDHDVLVFHASARPGPVCPAYSTPDLPPPFAPLIQAGLALSEFKKARFVRVCRLPAGVESYAGRVAGKFGQPGGPTQRFAPDPNDIECGIALPSDPLALLDYLLEG